MEQLSKRQTIHSGATEVLEQLLDEDRRALENARAQMSEADRESERLSARVNALEQAIELFDPRATALPQVGKPFREV